MLAAGLALASWRRVLGTSEREHMGMHLIMELDTLGDRVREQYVHQAHTFIVGTGAHLDHHDEAGEAVMMELATIEAFDLDSTSRADVGEVRAAVSAFQQNFADRVVEPARAGELDRARAASLHAEQEAAFAAVAERLGRLQARLEGEQERERVAAADATRHAWRLTALLALTGLALAALVARRLAQAVLGPVAALQEALRAFGTGRRDARAPVAGDRELAELAEGFNAMADAVGASEERRVRAERLGALGEMSAAVAHELMSPLAVILGDPATRRPELAAVREEAEHARRIVQGLLGFARPGEEPAVVVDLAEAARAALERALPEADVHDVRLALAVRGAPRVTASPSAVRQVLDNLLRNAIEASPEQGIVEVEVGDGPMVRILDRGPGIPASVQERLYEPFATGRPTGTGLGLAVCQRIARAMGGRLAHAAREGGGTVATWVVVEAVSAGAA